MKKWVVGIVIAVVVLAGAGFAFWYTQIRVDTKDKAKITTGTTATTTAGETPDGTWKVEKGDDTFVGYRAQEVVFGQSQTPTGRTSGVTGTMTVAGNTISDVKITADLTTLSTGEARRDQRAQSALNTSQHPDAVFTQTEPVTLASTPKAGEKVKAEITGDLTINGVTKPVTFSLEALWNGSTIQVAGTPDVKFSDYSVDVGSFQPIADVEDAGQIDIQLTLVPA